MSVTVKPAPVKPIIKPKSAANPQAPAPAPSPAKANPIPTSKQAAAIIKAQSKPKVQPQIAPEDLPDAGVDADVPVPPETFVGKQGKATISKQNADGTTETEHEDVGEPQVLKSPHATVGVSVSITKNTAPYENVKATVTLFLPCELDETAIEETYVMTKEWVDNKISEINDEIESQMSAED